MRSLLYILMVAGIAAPASAAEPPVELLKWLQFQRWERDVESPILSLGGEGGFDDRHIFAPAVIKENDQYSLWYSGSRGNPGNRVFRLGLARSPDGTKFQKHEGNPVLQFADAAHSVLTPAPLRSPNGNVLRENGKLRLYFSSAMLGKSGLHTLHQSHSGDGVTWDEPSPALKEHVYCPSVMKEDDGTYHMWYSDVSRRPWVIRHASSPDGTRWTATERPALVLSQEWEGEVLTYPTVLKADGAYLMWYGSYDHAIRRETTAIGFAASLDGKNWYKNPQNPVLRPDPNREWESNYVGSGSMVRLADGSFRYYYASRKKPPFLNLYFAINTASWTGPGSESSYGPLRLPPEKGDKGLLIADAAAGRSVELLETIDETNAIVRAWYLPASGRPRDVTFIDLWLRGVDTKPMPAEMTLRLRQPFEVIGNQLIDTTCGRRSFVVLEAIKRP
jgi:predicted GH43/DUF377 family glycosyl hydrolase